MKKEKTFGLKLHDIPNKSKIYCECTDGSKYVIFDHTDGMYSYCVTEKGGVIHLGMMQSIRKHKDGYKII